jgi:hypothetical protein
MANYHIKFFKTLLSSDGHKFKCLQRVIPVDQSDNSDDAIRVAQRQFEGLENVEDWRLRADFCEASAEQPRTHEANGAA